MRRRGIVQPASMTSLIDVLFILVFASLVQSAAARQAASTPPPRTDAPPVASAAATTLGGTRAALREQALAELWSALAARPVLVARISRDGRLTALELPDRRVELGVPLLERVPDRDVVVAYLGERSTELQICRIAALRLGADLQPYLVVIAPEASLAELQVALVTGLQHDVVRCQRDQGVAAVVVDPTTPPSASPGTPPSPDQPGAP